MAPRGLAALAGASILACSPSSAAADRLLFAGGAGCDNWDTACDRDSPDAEKSIWAFALSPDGQLRKLGSQQVPGVPAWLAWAPQRPDCLFATMPDVNKVMGFGIVGNKVEPRGAAAVSGGINPVHATLTQDGSVLLVANYHGPDDTTSSTGASVASLRIAADCSLQLAASVPVSGSSVVHGRQDSAHAHSFTAGRNGLGYACDLGQDAVLVFKVGPQGELTKLQRVAAAPGDGPRHLVEHPSLPLVYVVNELACSVTAYGWQDNSLKRLASYSTLREGVAPNHTKAAEIAISHDGRRLYATNRGSHNTVAVFDVLADGSLKQLQQVQAPSFPRGMLLKPDGSLLLVAGQHAGVVQTFRAGSASPLEWTGVTATGPATVSTLAIAGPLRASAEAAAPVSV